MLENDLFSSGKNLLLPALKMQWTVSDKPVSAFTASTPPRASADPSGHIQGSSGKGALPCSPGLPAREHPMQISKSCHSSTALLQPWGRKCLSPSVPEHLRSRCSTNVMGAGDMGLHTAPGAIHAAGIQVQLQPAVTEQCPCQKAGWKLTVGMGIRAGENKLSFRVHYGNIHFHGQFPPCLGTSPVAGACKHHTGIPTKLPGVPTSSTLHTASFPSAVRPDVQGILLLFWLASVFSSIVYRDGVFIMNSIILVME